jgi:Fe-S cluster assembly iron-binding protein IscA
MNLSQKAEKRLKKLLSEGAAGFSVTGFVGTCRGSTPVIQPALKAEAGQITVESAGLSFFVNAEIAERFSTCNLDYDGSFLGKGLTATWPQCDKCACDS